MVNSLWFSTQSLVQMSSCRGCGSRAYLPPGSLSPAPSSCVPAEDFPSVHRPKAAVELFWEGEASGSKETLCLGPFWLTGLAATVSLLFVYSIGV